MSDKYQISGWLEGCIQREIERHVINERERIIKLLEKDCENNLTPKPDDCVHQELIALIKGEK